MIDASIVSAAWLGLVAGVLHAASGPDHVAGVAPFAADGGHRAWRTGVAWGLGHASGAGCAAIAALVLRERVPGLEEHLSAWSERIVGVLLCAVGAIGLRAALRSRAQSHAHDVHGERHTHAHWLGVGFAPRGGGAHAHSVFALGLFHGAAGLSHLFAVLPALALPGVAAPASYLGAYALGSLATITLVAAGIGRLAPSSKPNWRRNTLVTASALSLAVGVWWIIAPLG